MQALVRVCANLANEVAVRIANHDVHGRTLLAILSAYNVPVRIRRITTLFLDFDLTLAACRLLRFEAILRGSR